MNLFNIFRGAQKPCAESRSSLEIIKSLLNSLNCKYEISDSDKSAYLSFTFQCGDFVIQASKESYSFLISFFNIVEAPIEHINTIRDLCNKYNREGFVQRITYQTNEESNKIYISIHVGGYIQDTMIDIQSYLSTLLTDCFNTAYKFRHDYEKTEPKDEDSEINKAKTLRERYLLRELEINSNPDTQFSRNPESKITLGALFDQCIISENILITGLEISLPNSPIVQHYTSVDEIKGIDIYSLIIDQTDGISEAKLKSGATLTLHYRNLMDPENEDFIFLINLLPDTTTDFTLYFRMSLCDISASCSETRSLNNNSRDPFLSSFLVAFDKKTDKQKEAEAAYMLDDAIDKINENKREELTDEQKLLVRSSLSDINYNLYWGTHFYLQERFMETIIQLDNIFISLYGHFMELDNSTKEVFYETCYMLGISYYKIGLATVAYYYLDYSAYDKDLKHIRAYISFLLDVQDYRTLGIIDNAIAMINKEYDLDEDTDSDVIDCLRFLYRSRVRYFIVFKQYDEAVGLLNQMARDPEETDFVKEQRAVIEQNKKANESSIEENPDD